MPSRSMVKRRGAGGGDDPDDAFGLQRLQLGGGDGPLISGTTSMGFHARSAQGLRVAHGDGVRVVRHLLAGVLPEVSTAMVSDTQALQGDEHFAQLAAAEQHDAGGRRAEGRSQSGHGC